MASTSIHCWQSSRDSHNDDSDTAAAETAFFLLFHKCFWYEICGNYIHCTLGMASWMAYMFLRQSVLRLRKDQQIRNSLEFKFNDNHGRKQYICCGVTKI